MARGTPKLQLEPRPRARRWRDFRPSVWTFVAPVAVAACVLVIYSIARDAGWTGHDHTTTVSGTTRVGGSTQAGGAILYRARKGDTITVIAVRFGLSVESIKALNPKLPADGSLPVGRRIRLR